MNKYEVVNYTNGVVLQTIEADRILRSADRVDIYIDDEIILTVSGTVSVYER